MSRGQKSKRRTAPKTSAPRGKQANGSKKTSNRSASSAGKRQNKQTKPAAAKPATGKEKTVLISQIVAKDETGKNIFPSQFPFWARLKIEKKRTTLVIDEVQAIDKKSKKMAAHFVHRETIHPKGDGSNVKGYENIEPNPDKKDTGVMYLKSPDKLPKKLFKPHNRKLDMPEHLKQRYDKNNHKNEQ